MILKAFTAYNGAKNIRVVSYYKDDQLRCLDELLNQYTVDGEEYTKIEEAILKREKELALLKTLGQV